MKIPYDASITLGREFIALSPDVTAAILLTLITGWEYALAFDDVNTDAGEVAMTERLRDGMRNELKLKGNAWGKMLIVLPGTESRSKSSTLLPDGRTDIPLMVIQIFLQQGEHDPHAIIECKRIAGTNAHLCREYVVEGIDRFRTGKYGENHAIGFMVGYLIAGSATEAVNGINAHLTRTTRKTEHLQFAPVIAPIQTWASQHKRITLSGPIKLLHTFLAPS